MNSKVCLTCLRISSKSHNINKIILENLKIIDLIRQVVPMLFDNQELTLPEIICTNCLKELVISFKFQKKCLNSLHNFHKIRTKNSLNIKVSDNNIEYNSFDENSTPSQPEDFKITIDQISIEPLTANNDVNISLEQIGNKDEESNGQIGKTSNNEHHNKKSCNDLPGKKLYPIEKVSSTHFIQCKICNKYFKQPQGLASHMTKTHLKKYLYQCKKCQKGFDVEEPFIRHYNRHLGIKPFQCSECVKSFETVGHLNKHKLCHSKEHIYTCKICHKMFHRIDVFKQHTRRHADEKSFQCLKCHETFERFSDHKKHLESHKSENFLEDEIIGKSSTSPIFHHQTENDQCEKDKSSDVQNRKVKNKDSEEIKNKEMEIVERPVEYIVTQMKSEKNYNDILLKAEKELIDKPEEQEVRFENEEQAESAQCDLCKQTFKNSQGLAIHRSSTHFKNYVFQCDQCDRGFSVEEFYIKHRNHHLGIKTFKCNQCDKVFETNSILNQHLISHSQVAPHLCTTCGKGFRRIDSLRQHMRRHGDERPFKCSVCPKDFKCLSDKLKHVFVHTKKRYECHICGTRLATSESLSQHKMIHTGEKPKKCKHCDKSFISMSNLKCHERIHTGEKPYNCQYCCKSFCQSSDRNKHTKRMHKTEVEDGKKETNY